ncbi:5'-nucleotidase domain-containing protein 1 isoform X2 [Acipenser ruthenus]|uniref:5'-nucleotidase domain-containing protein 1 isoform X2 n=1 Tax=Acipenser ruthenus TaxID=7906 RepID=UPI002740564E|nr:5'-nucleotidase domain-containing protein 1 isoform X2 [Acipenser ruthenus]
MLHVDDEFIVNVRYQCSAAVPVTINVLGYILIVIMSDVFSLSDCDVVGFDLDHTLCRYHLLETSRLIYDSFARYLVEHKGYDKELLTLTPDRWDFWAARGTKILSTEEIVQHYGKKQEWQHFNSLKGSFTRSAKYYFYDNYFDLPGALLSARVVDQMLQSGNQRILDFWKDMMSAIDHNYNTSAFKENTGTYFPSVKKDPGKYLQPCSEAVKAWLRSLKNAGKVLLLITSSHSDYCRLVCEHILGKDFEELFEVVITNALKPGFFSQIPEQRPFRTLVNDEESTEGLPSLDKPGWYSQGNWAHLHELLKTMTGQSEPQVVYFGDSVRSDVFPASCYGNWETVLISEELEGEGAQTSDMKSKDADAEPLEKKGKYDSKNMKTPSAPSEQWGSYFVDVCKGLEEEEEEGSLKYTWCCHSINTYSTIAIPSIEAIADLPLDYKFPRFSPNKPRTTGYYPRPPESLLRMSENSPRE